MSSRGERAQVVQKSAEMRETRSGDLNADWTPRIV